MKDRLKKSNRKTSEVSTIATGSPELEFGLTPYALPDGQTKKKSGQLLARVSRSPRRAKGKGSATRATFGQGSFFSSPHDILSASLANRYRALTGSAGSTLYSTTWGVRVTPAGASIPAQRARARRISGRDSIGALGWPTPAKRDFRSGMENRVTGDKRRKHAVGLNDWVLLGWPSPQSRDWKSGKTEPETMAKNSRPLSEVVTLLGWNTPRATDGTNGGPNQAGGSLPAALTGWATPQARDHFPSHSETYTATKRAEGHGMKNLNDQVQLSGWANDAEKRGDVAEDPQNGLVSQALLARGQDAIGFLLGPNGWAICPAFGQLNPAHSRFLMGLPLEWDIAAEWAFLSLREKKRGSSD